MTDKWLKFGQLYCPAGLHCKLMSHAANPLPMLLEGDIYRIFFCGRNNENRSSVGAVDIDVVRREILKEHRAPFFEYGPPGSFYEFGVSIGNSYEIDGTRYILFMGWQNNGADHWRGDIGRLILKSDWTLALDSELPLLGADDHDPLSLSYPCVLVDSNGLYSMWYGSTATWDAGNGEMLHVINSATSDDGHRWTRRGLSIPYEIGPAQAFSRPTVVRNSDGSYEMWFSYRGPGRTYRIGHATSNDRVNWELAFENAGIDVSQAGWDSEMIEYPFVFDHKGFRYMLYNGNGFGKTGFGLAVLETR